MSKYPDFVPKNAIYFYEKNWEKEQEGLPKRATDTARRLVTDERMRSVYKTLEQQSPAQDWGRLLLAMIWPVLHKNEHKIRIKEDEKNYKKTLSQAIATADKLTELLRELSDLSVRSADTCPSTYELGSPLALLHRAASLDSVLPETRCRYEAYAKAAIKGVQYQFDLKYFPEAQHLVEAMANSMYETLQPMEGKKTDPALFSNKVSWRDNLALFIGELTAMNAKKVRLREVDYMNWVDVAIQPSYPVSEANMRSALLKISELYPSESFLLKKDKK